jgi:hypothetical protein
MTKNAIETFIDGVRAAWGPLTTEMVASCRHQLEALAREPLDLTEDRELHRDAEHGFLLLAHIEREGRYRVPHDHGSGWVIYAVVRGEMEMGTYARVIDANGALRVVQRDVARVRAGEARVYLPGDIHDTRCLSTDVLMVRLTSCDLKVEDREGRMTRYAPASFNDRNDEHYVTMADRA